MILITLPHLIRFVIANLELNPLLCENANGK